MNLTRIVLLTLTLVGVGLGIYWLSNPDKNVETNQISTEVSKGDFIINVTATGELQAKNSEKIQGPQGMRSAGIWQTSITDLVPEGTVVKAGDYVATLDRTELANKISEANSELEKIETQLQQAKIDTAINLRGVRDNLINLNFQKKEKLLEVEQSKYEAPMVINRAKIELERTDRDYNQLLNNYKLKQEQAEAKIQEIDASLKQNQKKMGIMSKLSKEFIINAPKPGMVIYARSWNGKKGPGSQISGWDPTVAELPDMSDMVSKTYVNEVDISKVKVGQQVSLSVDAFPENSYSGEVLKVANIGEQLPKFDSKVFEVIIQLNEVDSILRPAMTTSNEILTNTIEDQLYLPLEAIYNDSLIFVFKEEDGQIVKQEVLTGMSNDNEIIISHGLKAKDRVYLIFPEEIESLSVRYIDATVKTEILQKEEAAEKERQARALQLEKERAQKKSNLPKRGGAGGGDVIMIVE
ncbi:MAG: efflux RND transporter periplasmic adaptor subunit [Saprospiraceae bacterium]